MESPRQESPSHSHPHHLPSPRGLWASPPPQWLGLPPGLWWERKLPGETAGLGQGLRPALCSAHSRWAWNQELGLPGQRDTPWPRDPHQG